MSFHILLEDGSGSVLLEDGTGFVLLEDADPNDSMGGGYFYSGRERLDDEEVLEMMVAQNLL